VVADTIVLDKKARDGLVARAASLTLLFGSALWMVRLAAMADKGTLFEYAVA
jgi:hypothetical protein